MADEENGIVEMEAKEKILNAFELDNDSDLSIDDKLLDSRDESHVDSVGYDDPTEGRTEILELMENFYRIKKPSATTRESIHERLYLKGEISATRRAKAFQLKKQEEMQVVPPKLELSTRSYTPLRERAVSLEKTHDRLYKSELEKKKRAILEEAKIEAYNLKHSTKQNTIDPSQSGSRLYSRSLKYVEEGKKIRREIEKKLQGRDPTPSRSISVSRAQEIYERGLQFKANREKKIQEMINAPRESSFPKMRTQTSRTRGRLQESHEDSRIRRSISTSRRSVRSQTPTRYRSQSLSDIHSRRVDRSMTPSRRVSHRSLHSTSTSDNKSPMIPRPFKINRSDS
jgi:hypothetical protein